MKWTKRIIIFLLVFITSINKANATCTSSEINGLRSEAFKIKTSYEITTKLLGSGEFLPPDGADPDKEISIKIPYFKIYINNLTENLYVTVYNDNTKETKTYNYQDSLNGTITLDWDKIVDIVNYTITVYSSDKTNCPDTKLYVTDLKTPRYNSYSTNKLCSKAKDFYLCKEYVTIPNVDYVTFMNRVQAYLDGQVNNEGEEVPKIEEHKKESFYNKNKVLIIVSICLIIISIGGVITVIIIKKRRGKKHEEV